MQCLGEAWPGNGVAVVARRSSSSCRAQEQAGRVARGNGAREERFQGNKGRRCGFGRTRGQVAGTGGRAGVRRRRRHGAREQR